MFSHPALTRGAAGDVAGGGCGRSDREPEPPEKPMPTPIRALVALTNRPPAAGLTKVGTLFNPTSFWTVHRRFIPPVLRPAVAEESLRKFSRFEHAVKDTGLEAATRDRSGSGRTRPPHPLTDQSAMEATPRISKVILLGQNPFGGTLS